MRLFVCLLVLGGGAQAQEEDRDGSRWESAWDPGFWGSPPTCSLDLRAGERRSEGQAEWFGIAVLQIPLTGCRENRVDREDDVPDLETTEPSESPGPTGPTETTVKETTHPEPKRVAERRILERRVNAPPRDAPSWTISPNPARDEALVSIRRSLAAPEASSVDMTAPSSNSASSSNVASPSNAASSNSAPSSNAASSSSVPSDEDKSSAPRSPVQPAEESEWRAPSLAFVRELVRRAVAASGLPREDEHLGDLAHRARWAGLAPELRLRGAMGLGQSTSLAGTGILPGDTTQRGTSDAIGEVRLTFRLSRLVFDDTESGLARMRLQLLAARQKRVEDALDLYLSWLEAERKRRKSSAEDEEETLEATVRAEAAALRLDVLTGGWFLAALPQK